MPQKGAWCRPGAAPVPQKGTLWGRGTAPGPVPQKGALWGRGQPQCPQKGTLWGRGQHQPQCPRKALCAAGRGLGAARPAPARPAEEGAPARQEARGVDSACGNDFIGKACDIFSPLVCGSWRRLEVYVQGTPSSRARPEPSGPSRCPRPAQPLPLPRCPLAAQPLLRLSFWAFFFFPNLFFYLLLLFFVSFFNLP